MATKTFKIGLSNTDKQNMAQEVYERLLALTFPEYDSAESYDVGDFVVYNDQLYKCIGATSGAWDSSKWQLATLNDLLTDIEDAVAFVNDKANVDGNYPTMTVGVADQLSPYDDESGDDQEEPFSFQATGTGNGTQPDFSTGAIALMKEKQGNSVVVNQWAKELNSSNWLADGTVTFSNGVATFTASLQYGSLTCLTQLISGHKYLVNADVKMPSANYNARLGAGTSGYVGNEGVVYNLSNISDTNWHNIFICNTFTKHQSGNINTAGIRLIDYTASDWGAIQLKNVVLVDLTQWFNGDIPQDLLDNPSNFFRYYQGSLAYNTGELVNANGRYIKCIGRNQWDEEWELGAFNVTTGAKSESNDCIRSKNLIRVIGGNDYYFKSSSNLRILCYDKDGNYLRYFDWRKNDNITLPVNCSFISIYLVDSYGTTYNNDITISLYYEGESGYDEYYPYEVLTNNDTGTEVLRSAGSVVDIKLPSGEIKRNVGTYTITNDTSISSSGDIFYIEISDIKQVSELVERQDGLACSKFVISSASQIDPSYMDDLSMLRSGEYVYFRDTSCADASAFLTKYTGTIIYYELATPTTEQGTPYSENIVIDDFGSMDFSGTSGVPQGNLIFYPVDYKAFIDTLYDYTEGTPSNIALKSDLPTAQQTWAESLSGYDATKTQTLKNVNGTLTWVDDE